MLNSWLRMRNGFLGSRRLMLAGMISVGIHLLLFDAAVELAPRSTPGAPLSATLRASPPTTRQPAPTPTPTPTPSAALPAMSPALLPAELPGQVAASVGVEPPPLADPGWRALTLEEAMALYRLNLWQCLQGEDLPALPAVGMSLQMVQEPGGEPHLQMLRSSGDELLDHRWLSLLTSVQARCEKPSPLQRTGFTLALELRP